MKLVEYIALFGFMLLVACALVWGVITLRQPQKTVIVRTDTLRIPPPPPVIVVRDSIVPKLRFVPYAVHDTTHVRDTLKILVFRRDSLGTQIARLGGYLEMVLDTITPSLDTVSITADEIRRQIRFSINYATRTAIVPRPVEVVRESPSWTVGVGVGYGAATDGKLYPTFNVNLSKVIFSF
ncbi:MAG: hypothetical protein JNL32_04785 [Candidatus Kapabacteria bacterium]|nr:hypothetical protein [Candidatus Kapabacteria bacterium]